MILSGSMHAIFAGRTTDAAGSPASASEPMATSEGQGRFAALVIIAIHMRLRERNEGAETTSAGRLFSASLST